MQYRVAIAALVAVKLSRDNSHPLRGGFHFQEISSTEFLSGYLLPRRSWSMTAAMAGALFENYVLGTRSGPSLVEM